MGLGRNFSGRVPAVHALLLAMLLACPLPFHNHGAEPSRVVSWAANHCTATGGTLHLHPATTRLAPECPACAAGPPASGIPTPAPFFETGTGFARVAPVQIVPATSWVECSSGARAPPLVLAA